jgi:hypothetical protein
MPWIRVSRDRNQWRLLLNTVTNIRSTCNTKEFPGFLNEHQLLHGLIWLVLLTVELYFYALFCSYSGSVFAILAVAALSELQSEMRQGHLFISQKCYLYL